MASFIASHRAYLCQGTADLVSRIEPVEALMRRPLLEQLHKRRAFLHDAVLADPADALRVYGLDATCAAHDMTDVAVDARDAVMSDMDRLVAALSASDDGAVARFVERLTARLNDGIDLRAGGATIDDAPRIFSADSAFHLLQYFTEMTKRTLDSFAPRSALNLRSTAQKRRSRG